METLTVHLEADGDVRVEVVARLVLAWLRRRPPTDAGADRGGGGDR